ncbi:hypothetical protein N7456_009655 [Penicillium angulare]|uniref:Uncharacterized protein n=1 Tax=Penicillium angulare TaxID=116970 RepID=A0A9W9K5G0_9EURO|nr:hypothetical protein N7456_009655 [Penicillium angulare]
MSLPYDVNESPEGGGHSSLGMFCTLPVEIRLIIWEHLFKTIRQAATWNSSWNPLSIMCCSSTLHHEISHHLYRELSLHVIIHTHIFRWGVLEVHSEKFHIQCVRDIKDKIVARDRLRAFPCQKFRIPEIAVSIDAPYEGDEGRRILSAQKVTQFVDILHELPQVPRVRVALVGEWVGERRPFLDHSPLGYYQMDHQKLNRRQIFDFDVAIMPFTGLTDWDYSIPSDLHTLLFTDERVKGTFLYQFRDHDSYNISPSKHLPEEVAQKAPRERLIFRRLVDRELDQAYGENAGILQSERVQSWYEPNDSWNSQYEKQLWRDLAADFDATMMIDPELNATRMRFKTVILCHDIAYKWFAKLPHGR